MKTISVSARSKSIQDLLKKAARSGVILKGPSGQRYVLAPLGNWTAYDVGPSGDFAKEVAATSRHRRLMKDLAAQQNKGPHTSLHDLKKQLGLK